MRKSACRWETTPGTTTAGKDPTGIGAVMRRVQPGVNFAAKQRKVDRLRKKRLSTVLQCLALGLRIATGGNRDLKLKPRILCDHLASNAELYTWHRRACFAAIARRIQPGLFAALQTSAPPQERGFLISRSIVTLSRVCRSI
jgi:hypothetical protein